MTPHPELRTADIAQNSKLGLVPDTVTREQCSHALLLITRQFGMPPMHIWPNGSHIKVKIVSIALPTDKLANDAANIVFNLMKENLPAGSYEQTETGLAVSNIADLALAMNAVAKHNPEMLEQFSALQKPLTVNGEPVHGMNV